MKDDREVRNPQQQRRGGLGGRALGLALALNVALSCALAAGPKVKFDIAAGKLTQSIVDFRHQSGVDATFVSGDVRGSDAVQTQAVTGEFDISDGLARMLAGSGVTFRFAQDGSVLIEPVAGPVPPSARGAVSVLVEDEIPPMAEVMVTGSFIRGLEAITAPLITVSGPEKKRAAYGTVQDVLRTLPQSFGGGTDEGFAVNGNFIHGSSLNLRGLGQGATLVLVNGRRQPASGIQGDFIDVSTIPWSAVDHIEVLTDGASALYGSDAVAGVVNIIMRDDMSGVGETQFRLGNTPGGADETLLAQSLAHHWDSGRLLFTYQYSERTSLATAARAYSANADKRPLGGSDLRSFRSNPGNILDPATMLPAFGIPSGQDGRSLTAEELLPGVINLYNQMADIDLLPNREAHSAFLTSSQSIGRRFTLLAEGRYNRRFMNKKDPPYHHLLTVPSSHAFFVDPYGDSPFVIVAYNFLDQLGPNRESGETTTYTGVLSLKTKLSDHWQALLSGHQGREEMRWARGNAPDASAVDAALADTDPNTAFNPFGSGSNTNPATLDSIRSTQVAYARSDIKAANWVVDGPLPDLPTGTPKLAIGADHRVERLSRHEGLGLSKASGRYERTVSAAFGELSLPLASRVNLSLAARYETHSDSRDSFNPKIGLRWAINESLRLRSSLSSSFRTPTLVDRFDQSLNASVLFPIADPHSANGYSLVLLRQGSNPDLSDERAKTWTAGLDFASQAWSGLTAASTFYVIHYDNQVLRLQPPLTLESFLADPKWTPLVTRNPSRSEIDKICRGPKFFGSVWDCLAGSPDLILDVRVRNLSATAVKGVDLELKQALQTDYGQVNLALNGGYVLGFERRITREAPATNIAGTLFGPPRLRMRGIAEWNRHGSGQPGWGASWAINYQSSARDDLSSPARPIASWVTFDSQVKYRGDESDSWWGSSELTLNAANVLNIDPPLVNRPEGYDAANAKPYGRVISLTLQKSW